MARFYCDDNHHVTSASGDLEARLGYGPGELWGREWMKVMRRRDDVEAVAAIGRDLQVGRVGQYSFVNVGKSGERFALLTRTFAVHADRGRSFGGVTRLSAWESPRTRLFLKDRN